MPTRPSGPPSPTQRCPLPFKCHFGCIPDVIHQTAPSCWQLHKNDSDVGTVSLDVLLSLSQASTITPPLLASSGAAEDGRLGS